MSASTDAEEEVFSLSPSALALIRRRFAVMGMVLAVLMAGFLWATTDPALWRTGSKAVAAAALIAGAMAFGLYRAYRQQRRVWATAQFKVNPTGVAFTAAGAVGWSVPWAEIASVAEFESSGLQLTTTGGRRLGMPSTLAGYDAARQAVGRRVLVTTGPSRSAGVGWLIVVTTMVAVVIGMTLLFRESTPRGVVVPVGMGLIIALVWSAVAMRRNPSSDARARRAVWLVLLVIPAIATRVVVVVAGWGHAR